MATPKEETKAEREAREERELLEADAKRELAREQRETLQRGIETKLLGMFESFPVLMERAINVYEQQVHAQQRTARALEGIAQALNGPSRLPMLVGPERSSVVQRELEKRAELEAEAAAAPPPPPAAKGPFGLGG